MTFRLSESTRFLKKNKKQKNKTKTSFSSDFDFLFIYLFFLLVRRGSIFLRHNRESLTFASLILHSCVGRSRRNDLARRAPHFSVKTPHLAHITILLIYFFKKKYYTSRYKIIHATQHRLSQFLVWNPSMLPDIMFIILYDGGTSW